ncbi:LOW QUALITY PROTEIN: hypothetical protein PAHAL_6G103600 [Panicum hallii]|uniref:Uncharacterized protein n=1 Tax=Panicum hallii TaxID=206008 RepID=A0A2S3I1P4_9POAL|nr:LOW QUALITY PROTEIN: hypothetical protein PAHAL_6G103600 [Panicum hallii]
MVLPPAKKTRTPHLPRPHSWAKQFPARARLPLVLAEATTPASPTRSPPPLAPLTPFARRLHCHPQSSLSLPARWSAFTSGLSQRSPLPGSPTRLHSGLASRLRAAEKGSSAPMTSRGAFCSLPTHGQLRHHRYREPPPLHRRRPAVPLSPSPSPPPPPPPPAWPSPSGIARCLTPQPTAVALALRPCVVFHVTKHDGGVLAGLTADGCNLSRFVWNECINHSEALLPVSKLALKLADKAQACSSRCASRS